MHTVVNRVPAVKIAIDYTPCDQTELQLALDNAAYRSELARAGWRIGSDDVGPRPDMPQLPSALAYAWLWAHRDEPDLQQWLV